MKKHKWPKKILRLFGKCLELFFAFLFFYLTLAIYGAVIPIGEFKTKGDLYIYVQSNGIHTDVCLPACNEEMNWLSFLDPKDYSPYCSFDFVTIGWGDKGFFLDTPTWAELKVSTALNAAFLPSNTAMHVKYSKEPIISETRKKVFIDNEEYKELINYIKKSFAKKSGKVALIEGRGYDSNDNFYEATMSYHLFRTCNRWTNEALKSANVKTGVFALFPNGILSH